MLYVIHKANHRELTFRGGQDPIVHLEADLFASAKWADQNGQRWAFTTSNAGSRYFNDYSDLDQLEHIDWDTVNSRDWQTHKADKQAEFLMEHSFPWHLISRIGIGSRKVGNQVINAISKSTHRPKVQVKRDWYY